MDKPKMMIILTDDQKKLLETGDVVHRQGDVYYNLPFWFKNTDGGNVFEIVHPNDLPEYVVRFFNMNDDLTLKTEGE